MENLSKQPRFWLTPKIFEGIFNKAKPLIQYDEPIPPFDTRFPGKLEGILASVRQTYDGKYLNPTVLDAAAAYFYQLTTGHAFLNGNKRLAVLFTHLFLLEHNVELTISHWGLYNFAIIVAQASKDLKPQKIKEVCKKVIKEYTQDFRGG